MERKSIFSIVFVSIMGVAQVFINSTVYESENYVQFILLS